MAAYWYRNKVHVAMLLTGLQNIRDKVDAIMITVSWNDIAL